MRIITGFLFFLNILAWLFAITISFFGGSSLLGGTVIIGLIVFLISWKISGDTITSPADYFFQPKWSIFKIKLKWANGGGISTVIILMLLALIFGLIQI